jgi:hypothetical protein
MRFQSSFMLMTVSAPLLRLVVKRLGEGANLAIDYALGRSIVIFALTSMASRGPSPAQVYSSICRSPVELPNEA